LIHYKQNTIGNFVILEVIIIEVKHVTI